MFASVVMLGSVVFAEEFPGVDVYEKTSKSVVMILSHFEGKRETVGSGSIIGKTGTVLTSAHVVVDPASGKPSSNVEVFIKPDKVTGHFHRDTGNRYAAIVTAYDPELDLAVVEMKGFTRDVEPIRFARDEEVRVGEEVVTIGHPEQGGLWTITYGRISGEIENQSDVPGKDVYQTDTSINRGNSGGPLLNRYGRLVGVTSNIARIGAGNLPITGVNFALKSGVASRWLTRNGHQAILGESPGPLNMEGRGAVRIDASVRRADRDSDLPGKPVFRHNDEIQVRIRVSRDAYLHIFGVDQHLKISKLYPGNFLKNRIVQGGEEFLFPSESLREMGFHLRVKAAESSRKTAESILIVATTKQMELLAGTDPENATVTDLKKELSGLDAFAWIDKTVEYEVMH